MLYNNKMKDEIYNVIADVFGIEKTKISEDLSKENFEKWDSIMHLSLIAELEEKFEISFEPEEIELINSVMKLREIIKNKIG